MKAMGVPVPGNSSTGTLFLYICCRPMKKLIAIFALTGILLQAFYSGIILVNYQLQKEYITKNLCENRKNPSMKCNGKCHLRKQLQKQEKEESNPFSTLREKADFSICNAIEVLRFSPGTDAAPVHFRYMFSSSSAFPRSIFHPPPVA